MATELDPGRQPGQPIGSTVPRELGAKPDRMTAPRIAAYSVHVPSADWTREQLDIAWFGQAVDGAVARFEEAASRSLDLEVLATGSARTALYLLIRALQPSIRRLLVPAFTCVAVPNAAAAGGVGVEWIDIAGLHMDVERAASHVRSGDAILVQHSFGIPQPDA